MSNVRRLTARAAKVRSHHQMTAEGDIWTALAEIRAVADLLAMVEDVTALDKRTVQGAGDIIRSRAIEVDRNFKRHLETASPRPPARRDGARARAVAAHN